MRERLIESLLRCDKEYDVLSCYNKRPKRRQAAEIIADGLLASGAIMPPCKVGDILYMPLGKILEYEVISWLMREEGLQLVTHSRTTGGLYRIWAACIGKTVFLTKEEAEAALKEGVENDNR